LSFTNVGGLTSGWALGIAALTRAAWAIRARDGVGWGLGSALDAQLTHLSPPGLVFDTVTP
jgi:hypothetical protein